MLIGRKKGEFVAPAIKTFTNVGGSDVCLIKVRSLSSQKPYQCRSCYRKICLPAAGSKPEHGSYCWVVGNPHNAFAELGVNIFSHDYCKKYSWLEAGEVNYQTEFCGGKPDLDGDGKTDEGEGICGSDRGGKTFI